jgi:hypothetical protein
VGVVLGWRNLCEDVALSQLRSVSYVCYGVSMHAAREKT